MNERAKRIEKQIIEKFGNMDQLKSRLSSNFFIKIKKILNLKGSFVTEYLKSQILYRIYALNVMGLSKLTEELFKQIKSTEYLLLTLEALYTLYCEPFTAAMAGYVNFDYKTTNFIRKFGTFRIHKNIVLPRDFIAELKESYFYEAPSELESPLRFVYRLHKENNVQEIFSILKSFSDEFAQGKYRNAIGEIKKAKEVIKEINAKIKSITRTYKQIRKIIRIGTVLICPVPTHMSIQALTKGEILSSFAWIGICAANAFANISDEEISEFFTKLKFKKTIIPYLIWQNQHKKEVGGV